MTSLALLIISLLLSTILLIVLFIFKYQHKTFKLAESHQQQFELIKQTITLQLTNHQEHFFRLSQELRDKQENNKQQISEEFKELQKLLSNYHTENLRLMQNQFISTMNEIRQQLHLTLETNTKTINANLEKLTLTTSQSLQQISLQVEQRLNEGFAKTTTTFTDIVKRLALIDEAQKKITELSSSVVSLKDILADKRSRGTFGEVQLASLIRNVLPENAFAFQHTLSNDKRVDCVIFLPAPTGNLSIDSKFPLESFQHMLSHDIAEIEKRQAMQRFRQDIKKHINDISKKYIIPGETAEGAVMFIPAEAVFAEIHSHFPDLVEDAQRAKVWMVSPTTMMAVLTTVRAVIKDDITRKQVHIIQEHLRKLGQDFGRFRERMNKLATHIKQANDDVKDVNTSAQKITNEFEKIDQVELSPLDPRLEEI